jgi:gamma-glutamylcyclotransferase (GGCT)/AIG2-like uncharacterized protein YtfP
MQTPVFVYGTLIRGQRNNRLLSESEFLGQAELNDYAMYDLFYFPGIKANPGSKVKGELYMVDESTLEALDKLEGDGYLYVRQKVKVLLDGTSVPTFTYVYNQEVDPKDLIPYENQPYKGMQEL